MKFIASMVLFERLKINGLTLCVPPRNFAMIFINFVYFSRITADFNQIWCKLRLFK